MSGLLHAATTVTFREMPSGPPLSPEAERGRAEHWDCASRDNPVLFDGRILLATGVAWDGSSCDVSYFESSFSRYLWSGAAGDAASAGVGALYVSVLGVTADGYLLAGRMGEDSSTPQRVQLPGGNVERPDGAPVTLDVTRSIATRELVEETGLHLAAVEMRLTHVKTGGERNDVGIFFAAELPWTLAEVATAFRAHVTALSDTGEFVEFRELVAFGRADGVDSDDPQYAVDYMDDAVRVALRLDGRALCHGPPRRYRPGVVTVDIEAT